MAVINETVLSLSDATRAVPKLNGKRPAISTIWRWCVRGIVARDGQRIRLEHGRLGRRVITSREAMARFSERLADAHGFECATGGEPTPTTSPRTDEQRQRDMAQAEQELSAAGF